MATVQTYYYLVSTREIWHPPGHQQDTSRSRIKLNCIAPDVLALLPEEEQRKALSFYFLGDARLSLASSLLKRVFVCKALGVPWMEATFARKGDTKHGKPIYAGHGYDAAGEVDFNVSHQAGIVLLAGICQASSKIKRTVSVGVDVTCTSERRARDMKAIMEEGGGDAGFRAFVDIHAEVFSEADLIAMKFPQTDVALNLKERLRKFYSYWALKEAYVKMEGEALLANWLKEVEFRQVKVPKIATRESGSSWGETVDSIEVWIRSIKRTDVRLYLQAFEEDYLIATAILAPDCAGEIQKPRFKVVDIEAEAALLQNIKT